MDQAYLSVAEANRYLNNVLETEVPELRIEGELSQVTRANSGHYYLTLKDKAAELSMVMWSGSARGLTFELTPGLAVRCHGRPNVYEKNGRLQIIATRIIPAGEGLLRKKFLELKDKLEKEGLFAPERKRPLPFFPTVIGVVTAGQGAVIHDIMVKIRERMPSTEVRLADVRVQGPGAAEEIAAGIRRLNAEGRAQVLIVGRGGGSLEDLWAFNEEIVVRAIFASKLPVISGVGHEVDVTLADLVADVRAPTPTAAAELVVPKRSELERAIGELGRRLGDVGRWFDPRAQALDELEGRLTRCGAVFFDERRLKLAALEARVRAIEPRSLIERLTGRVAVAHEKLRRGAARDLNAAARRLDGLGASLRRAFPPQRVGLLAERVALLEGRLSGGVLTSFERRRHRFHHAAVRLESASPLRVLERGFALVERDGVIVRDAREVQRDDAVRIRLGRGSLGATVTAVEEGGGETTADKTLKRPVTGVAEEPR
jgi:exodeoxyribonuclease VII large subunit